MHHKNATEEIAVFSLVVRAADMILEGLGFESRLGYHFSWILSSFSDSWHYPCSVENVQGMKTPNEMGWVNKELESPVGRKQSAAMCC